MDLTYGRITKSIMVAMFGYFGVSNVAFGAIITYVFSGKIEQLYEADYLDHMGGYAFTYLPSSSFFGAQPISVGDRFHGIFSYDTEAKLNGISSDGAQASYLDAVVSSSLTIGIVTLPSSAAPSSNWFNSIAIVNDRTGVLGGKTDIFQISPKFSGDDFFVTTTLSLQDRTAGVFDDLDLPGAVAMEAFQGHLFKTGFLNRATRDQLQLSGTLDSFEAKTLASVDANVPEPSTSALLALALMGAYALRRRT